MPETIRLALSTVAFRPYVFVFLAVYLTAALFKLGPRKTLLFTLSAWFLAYLSEFSSIRNGIPFGPYSYIPSTAGRELWVWGVPFMDSLSFTFLVYASWGMARVFLSPSTGKGLSFTLKESDSARRKGPHRFSWDVMLLGALFVLMIDVVIDPLALRGDRWFLGRIYRYPVPGVYFGVTLANFAGWFVVGLATLTAWRMIDKRMKGLFVMAGMPTLDLWAPALYYMVLVFNLFMTFYIGEYALAWAGVFMFLPVTALLILKLLRRT